jgi:hypothetical protein
MNVPLFIVAGSTMGKKHDCRVMLKVSSVIKRRIKHLTFNKSVALKINLRLFINYLQMTGQIDRLCEVTLLYQVHNGCLLRANNAYDGHMVIKVNVVRML